MYMSKILHLQNMNTKFEAGTQNVEGAVGLGAAIDYLNNIGMDNVEKIEKDVLEYAMKELSKIDFITLYGPKELEKHAGVISFNVNKVHPHDVASILDSENVCIRSGNHCAQPLLRYMGLILHVEQVFIYTILKKMLQQTN